MFFLSYDTVPVNMTYFRSTCTRTGPTRSTWELKSRGKSSQKMLIKWNIAALYLLLGRYFNYTMDNHEHKCYLLSETDNILNKIDKLPLHPRFKLDLYEKYLPPKISWHLVIADINKTWVKQTLDTMCHSKFRSRLEMSANGTLDVILQVQSKFSLNITDVSTKHAQCQVVLRNKLKTSQCPNIRTVHSNTTTNTNIQYDRYTSAKEVVKEIRDKIDVSRGISSKC